MKNEHERYVTELDIIGMHSTANPKLAVLYGKGSGHSPVFCGNFLSNKTASLESVEDFVKRDKEREQDGLPKRVRWKKILVAPGKVITIPYVEEPQLVHGKFEPKNIETVTAYGAKQHEPDLGEMPGSGKGEVGDVVGEVPIGHRGAGGKEDEDDGDGDTPGPGAGDESGEHFDEGAYELGKRLTEQLKLPELKKKVRKFPTDEYIYDLTDRHRGSGQVLDKKETVRQIIKMNLALGRITKDNLDPSKMIVGPEQRVYRVLSRERVWKAQSVAFFLRDYSGSMWGEPTQALVSQHLMIYAWLMAQYKNRVTPRFFVHDTEAREVTAQQYFLLNAWGGTYMPSGYKEISNVVEGEGLERQYNLYLFQGTDGDDGDDGTEAVPEIRKILGYVDRMGVTLFKHPYFENQNAKTVFEKYVEEGGILKRRDVFRMHIMSKYRTITDEMNIQAIKALIAQD